MFSLRLILALLALGCNRTLYVPNALNMPLLEKGKDYNINLVNRPAAPINLELQGSYAPINHFALMGNASAMVIEGGSHRFIEGGAGVFTSWHRGSSQVNVFRAEFFGGYGVGAASHESYFLAFDKSEGSYHRKFIQPGFGIKSGNFEFGLGARFSEINFGYYNDYSNGVLIDRGIYNFVTYEPIIRLAVGHKGAKLALQMGGIRPLGGNADFEAVTDESWINTTLFGSLSFGSWPKSQLVAVPSISLKEAEGAELSGPIVQLKLSNPNFSICVSHVGQVDPDMISIAFNGLPVAENLMLSRNATCFELEAMPGMLNRLVILGISAGNYQKNRLKLLINDGAIQRPIYLDFEVGKVEEIHLAH